MTDQAMRLADFEFSVSDDGKLVRATIDGTPVVTALLLGSVDEARQVRLAALLRALAIECLEAVPESSLRVPRSSLLPPREPHGDA
jgi:hypothetical protein